MIKRGDKLPDKQHVMEMEDQLEFKGTELKNAEVTAVRLRTELDQKWKYVCFRDAPSAAARTSSVLLGRV